MRIRAGVEVVYSRAVRPPIREPGTRDRRRQCAAAAVRGGESARTASARQVLAATNADSVAHALSDAYSDVVVRSPDARQRMRMRLEASALPNVNLVDLTLSESSILAPGYSLYTVCLPQGGTARISSGGASALVQGNQGVVISGGRSVVVDYLSDLSRVRTIHFRSAEVDAELSAMLGRPISTHPRFDFRLDHSPGRLSAFRRAVDLVDEELAGSGGLTDVPAMSARLGRLVIAGLLVSQPHDYTDELTGRSAAAGPRAIRAALAAIEERPAELQVVSDIAKASGLSVRALDEGFRRHVGTPPMAYLRRVRLARAHEELGRADPEQTTATTVARNWGFWHYGRFAAEYRKTYGRTPAETLREPAVR
jgi:AraC-like DNA-binding protein